MTRGRNLFLPFTGITASDPLISPDRFLAFSWAARAVECLLRDRCYNSHPVPDGLRGFENRDLAKYLPRWRAWGLSRLK